MGYIHKDWMLNAEQARKLHHMQFPNLQEHCECLFSRLSLATKAILRSVFSLSSRPPSGFITELLWINIQRFPRQHGQFKMSPKPNGLRLCYKEWLLPNHRATYNWWRWAWWGGGVGWPISAHLKSTADNIHVLKIAGGLQRAGPRWPGWRRNLQNVPACASQLKTRKRHQPLCCSQGRFVPPQLLFRGVLVCWWCQCPTLCRHKMSSV